MSLLTDVEIARRVQLLRTSQGFGWRQLQIFHEDPATPFWAKALIIALVDKDPVDAAHVLSRLAGAFMLIGGGLSGKIKSKDGQ